jgi:hypothetical protein
MANGETEQASTYTGHSTSSNDVWPTADFTQFGDPTALLQPANFSDFGISCTELLQPADFTLFGNASTAIGLADVWPVNGTWRPTSSLQSLVS